MKATYFIARRLRLNSDNTQRLSTSVIIAISGIALSVMVMLLSIAIVSGFKKQIKDKVAGFESQVSILASHAYSDSVSEPATDFLTLDAELKSIIDDSELFKSYSLSIKQPAILKTENDFEGIVLYGIESDSPTAKFVRANLTGNNGIEYLFDGNKIVISSQMANSLKLNCRDKVYAYFFIDGTVRARRFEVSDIYNTNFSDYDKVYAFVPLHVLQRLHSISAGQASQIDLECFNADKIDDSALNLQQRMMLSAYTGKLSGTYRITTVNDNAMMYLNWLELLDTNVVVILILMSLVAGFTLISSLFIIILERVSTIGLLKAMGASDKQVRHIFTAIGWRLVLRGMIIGNAVALLIVMVQYVWHIIPLDPSAYYLSYVPVRLNLFAAIILNVGVFVVSWSMLLIPVRIISKISPAKSLRYE
ncbi:FtsX-like permease family protein [uncultured Muribaculum sp.]|uniref:ABC transporter permease n=1 Tax=uncultured Muribaculum sp. TaxID=1918613 RepID=UPI0025B7A5B2|nr:FtsX-like permease family protein [uncultured Muribaculum sp.]